MDLREYLSRELYDAFENHKTLASQDRQAIRILQEVDLDNSSYIVTLRTMYPHQKSVQLGTKGSLELAIKNAEDEFKKLNKTSFVQALELVEIKIGEVRCQVPEEFWKKFIQHESSGSASQTSA